MIPLKGKFNEAIVFTDKIENEATKQIITLCNQEFCKDSKIRIMPDCHAGAGCTIGTTMTITDRVVPSLVGVDIGCGMEVVQIAEKFIDFEKLDNVIRTYIPSGCNVREVPHKYAEKIKLENLICSKHINLNRAYLSICSVGSGNHFLEISSNSKGDLFLIVHSGSRYLGKQVAEYYQDLAFKELTDIKDEKLLLVERLKKEHREKDIQKELKKIKAPKIDRALSYLEGASFKDYIEDMKLTQYFAMLNRQAIADEIISRMHLTAVDSFTTIHNYIDTNNMILRKGAISAQEGEKVIIPMNMRDGSLICTGRGNSEWNFSAPHGAGRLMSRHSAKEKILLSDFVDTMKNVWSTSVCSSTIDESPMAYKPMEEIISNIGGTVVINDIIKPLYNFKAS